ncbi:MAG: hypothetical protein RIS35_575, partial [Pseudomonadota bacterium]
RLNVTEVQTQSRQHIANMRFTVEVSDRQALQKALSAISEVPGVLEARRR